jgi:endoglucanase
MITEYEPSGAFTLIAHIYPTATNGWSFSSNNSVGAGGTTSDCKTSATCLTITGTTDDASWGGDTFYFRARQGYQYGITGWMKGTNLPAGAVARIRIDLVESSTPVHVRERSSRRDMISPYLAWGAAHDVPLYLGAFGADRACFAYGKGGVGWVGDVYDLATGDGVAGGPRVAGLSYHQYHEDAFGLYAGTGQIYLEAENGPLISLLDAKLHAAP